MEAFNNVGLEGFSLFFVRVLVLICDEVSVGSVEGEHQTMKFTVGDDGDLEIGIAKQFPKFEGFL